MIDSLEIQPLVRPADATLRPPGSKSITNRALVCAALATGSSRLTGALASEDTRVMIDALGRLGIAIDCLDAGQTLHVAGCGGKLPVAAADLYVANSGTTVRFLTALVALGRGSYRLDGTPRMRERPIQDLLDTLAQLGVRAHSEMPGGCPPVVIEADGLRGGRATVRGEVSSQFLSGLLMAAPYALSPLELVIAGPLVSQPYIRMTLAVMKSFGVAIEADRLERFRVAAPLTYRAVEYDIEPDASAASYFWAAAAISGGRVAVEGLSRESLQGDVAFCDCLAQMGCPVVYGADRVTVVGGALRGIDVDMNAISDTVQTLSAVALFADGPTRIRGVGHIRHKETDRIGALATELRKLGAKVDEHVDGLTIVPGKPRGATIDTYNDHRMAMSLSLVGLRVPGVVINDPGCTAKTYPRFFDDLSRLNPARV
ncbi:MAG TPA: 3-phosphoshikimate 1-carboxyvinyltransferase [Pirellulales bacterium]|jgi:3-phosphoshikimate 1-carboxyvinyltransferase|nr:3-phosphoshikimate 1-carboxyvinyltransferase [Pirellulales bacterium]